MKNSAIAPLCTAVASLALLMAGCGERATTTAATALPAAAPAVPKHIYAIKDGLEYGYEQALSDQDRNQGRVAKSLLMFSYLGKKDGAYQVMLKDDNVRTVAECALPCEYAKIYTFVDVTFIKKETIPINPSALLAGVFADAISGQLEQMQGLRDGTVTTFWVDGDKKRLIVADAKTSGVTR
ncbi:MAG: hypothetical protein Q8R98_03980 [Rubrivivax sp.]|nr:hypothetical protein [Rubrivivax sp.]